MQLHHCLRSVSIGRQSMAIRIGAVLLTFVAGIFITLFCGSINDRRRPVKESDCYRRSRSFDPSIELFPDLLAHAPRPDDTNIFFHETGCRPDGLATLNARQACAIESTARSNPNAQVHVLFASPVGHRIGLPQPRRFGALAKYPNVRLFNVDLWSYANRTPAADWMRSEALFEQSIYLRAHMADLLRLLSVFRWGGTHVDLDFVVRSSLAHLRTNWAAEEQTGLVSNALFNVGPDAAIGHPLAKRLIAEFVGRFNGGDWSANGPRLLTRMLSEHCGRSSGSNASTSSLLDCETFNVLPSDKFFAVYYPDWRQLFDAQMAVATMRRVRLSLAVHLWNKMSAAEVVRVGERSAYERMARTYCPHVFATVSPAFEHGTF